VALRVVEGLGDVASGAVDGPVYRPPVLAPPGNLRRDVTIALVGLLVVVVSGAIVYNGRVGAAERAVFRAINDLPGWLYPVMWPLQQLGNLVFGLVVAAGALILRRWRLALGAVLVTFIDLEWLVKDIVDRRRPGTTVPGAELRGDVPVASQSFPSGHAVLIASLAVLVTPYLRGRWQVVPWLLVAGVCIGRVYVGAHNPLDVVAGCGLGMVIGGVVSVVVHLSPAGPRRPVRTPNVTASPAADPDPRLR
jgi:membrane-associated phospholipid phosphatase